jgi:hypothetical protein
MTFGSKPIANENIVDIIAHEYYREFEELHEKKLTDRQEKAKSMDSFKLKNIFRKFQTNTTVKR